MKPASPLGFLVAIWDPNTGQWGEDWDGTVHLDRTEAEESATEANLDIAGGAGGGYTVVVCELTPVEDVRVGCDGGPS